MGTLPIITRTTEITDPEPIAILRGQRVTLIMPEGTSYDADGPARRADLTPDQARRLIADLTSAVARATGSTVLTLTIDEPIMSDDLSVEIDRVSELVYEGFLEGPICPDGSRIGYWSLILLAPNSLVIPANLLILVLLVRG